MYLPEVISLSNLKETYFVQEVTRSRRSSKLVSYRCCLCLADLVTMHTAFVIIRFLIDREVQNKQWCLVYIHELRFTACTLRWKLHVSHQSGHISLLYTWQGPASLPACFRVYIWVHNWNFRLLPTTFSTNNFFYHSNKIRTSYSVAAVLHVEIFKVTCLHNCWKTHHPEQVWPWPDCKLFSIAS